jgi:hypothetical protein
VFCNLIGSFREMTDGRSTRVREDEPIEEMRASAAVQLARASDLGRREREGCCDYGV